MAVAISRTADPAGAGTGTTITYSGQSIGVAEASRIVVVCVGTELTSGTPSSCTIGGVTANASTLGTIGAIGARIFWLPVATGTTADIAVTFGASQGSTTQHICVYRVVGASISGESAVGDTDADPISSGAITIPAKGGCIAICSMAGDTTARTWTGITVDLDEDAGTFRFTTGTSVTGGTPTITVSGANQEDGALAWLLFRPGVTAEAGAYSLTGTDATPRHGYAVGAGVGSYAIVGTDANVHRGLTLVAGTETYAIVGTDPVLKHGWKVAADVSSYAIVGTDVTLTKAGGGPSVATLSGMFMVN